MRQPTLLLVDSYAGSRSALAGLLRECGYTVIEVYNAVEGLKRAHEQQPALVIADLWPFVSASLQLVERLGESGGSGHIPVLVLTSSVSPQYRTRALAAGCAGYLEKPCAPEKVLAEIERILTPSLSMQGIAFAAGTALN